jgi:hypothetical protein
VIVGSDVGTSVDDGASVGADDGETLVSLVGLRVGDTVIDDDLILFVSFNCSDNLSSLFKLVELLYTNFSS